MKAERGDRGGVGMAEYAEDPAFLAQAVVIEPRLGGRIFGNHGPDKMCAGRPGAKIGIKINSAWPAWSPPAC
jgi:hypothetical protein